MPDLHAAVIGYLTTKSWAYEDHGDGIVTDVSTDTGSWTVIFDIRDKQQQLIVYSIVPVEVPPATDRGCAVPHPSELRARDRDLRA